MMMIHNFHPSILPFRPQDSQQYFLLFYRRNVIKGCCRIARRMEKTLLNDSSQKKGSEEIFL